MEVEISGLTKKFGDLTAVNNIDLEVPEGCIFGLLGPNGAGKSTTIRLLCTLLKPTAGRATMGGYDTVESPVDVRRITGVLPEEGNHTLYPSMTVYENLEYFAKLYSVSDEHIPARIEDLLGFMDLWNRRNDPAGELSTGNRQRLALSRALLHNPSILLLDEPTSALDPIAAKRVRELILELSKEYKQTFFINSHNLAEVQRICDRIAIIDEGRILLAGSTSELREKLHGKQQFRIRVVSEIQRAAEIIRSKDYCGNLELGVDTITTEIEDPHLNNPNLMKSLLDKGVKIIEFAEEEASLEDLYLKTIKGGND